MGHQQPLINQIEPNHIDDHLAGLAVFMNSHKEEHIKSIHLYNRNGEIFSLEQEYLLNPGNYASILSEPVDNPSIVSSPLYQTSFGALTSALSVTQLMASLRKVQETDGWKCVVQFTSDCPHETTMIELLTPSRNADLQRLPSLAHDLALAEAALIQRSSGRNLQINTSNHVVDQSFNGSGMTSICTDEEGGEYSTSKLSTTPWVAVPNPSLTLPSSSADIPIFNDIIPGLETPDRTPFPNGLTCLQGLQCSLWQTWGSDLELASPRVSQGASQLSSWRSSLSDCIANPGAINFSTSSPTSNSHVEDISLWSPSLLDLSLNLPDITLDQQSEALLQLEGPTDDVSQLNLDVTDASFSLPDSTLTGCIEDAGVVDANGIDCFSLECFGLDSSTCCTSFYPEYEIMESKEQPSSGSLCVSANNLADNNAQMSTSISMRQLGFQGFSPLDTFLGHVESSMALSSESNLSNGLQGMASTASHVDNAYSSTSTAGGTLATASSDMYWDVSRAIQSTSAGIREGRVLTRRSAAAQGTATSSNMGTQKHNIQRGSSERVTEITIQELSQYFNMPITQASKELKVGLTVLKKKCREFGIPRWPHRKMKSLDSLINNIQDLASEHGGRGSARVLNAVKELEEQKKLMEEMPGIELAERTKRLRQACFKASYKKRRLLSNAHEIV